MTYAEAQTLAKSRDQVRKDWEAENAERVASVHQFDRVAAYNKLEGAPPNMNFAKHKAMPGMQMVELDDGVYFVPSSVMAATSEIIKQCTSPYPLSILNEDCWTVRSWLDDLDW
jgi:hypothetical protein